MRRSGWGVALVVWVSVASACAPSEDGAAGSDAEPAAPTGSVESEPESEARDCSVGPDDAGSWYGILDPALVAAAPASPASGLEAIAAALPASTYAYASVALPFDGAVVTMLGEDPTVEFWLEDGWGAVHVALDAALDAPVAPGDEVEGVVGAVRNFDGQLLVTRIDTISARASGVPVQVREDGPIDLAVAGAVLHHAWGTVGAEVAGCTGDVKCVAFEDVVRGAIVLRVPRDAMLLDGDCLEAVSPIGYAAGASFVEIAQWDQFRWY